MPYLSFKVTVTVLAVDPSAGTVKGLALIIDVDATTAPAEKITEAVRDKVIPSVESVAVNMAVAATVEETANVTTPFALEAPDAAPILTAPRFEARLTVLPGIGFPSTSVKVTVTVLVAVPLAVTLIGLATTVELLAETAPVVKVMVAVVLKGIASEESVALSLRVPTVVAVIGKVT